MTCHCRPWTKVMNLECFYHTISSATCQNVSIVVHRYIIYFTVMVFYQFFQRRTQYLVIDWFLGFLWFFGWLLYRLLFKEATSENTWFFIIIRITRWLRGCFLLLLSLLELLPLLLDIKLLCFELFVFLENSHLELIHLIQFLSQYIFLFHIIR